MTWLLEQTDGILLSDLYREDTRMNQQNSSHKDARLKLWSAPSHNCKFAMTYYILVAGGLRSADFANQSRFPPRKIRFALRPVRSNFCYWANIQLRVREWFAVVIVLTYLCTGVAT